MDGLELDPVCIAVFLFLCILFIGKFILTPEPPVEEII